VFANGNILYFSDIKACLEATGADAVMSAEGNLYNPALFRPSIFSSDNLEQSGESSKGASSDSPDLSLEHIPHTDLAWEYLQIIKELKTPTDLSFVKGHLFKLLRPGLATAIDLRNRMGKPPYAKSKAVDQGQDSNPAENLTGIPFYEQIVMELKERMEVSWLNKL
jgi:tRNA-dihydrouridine synthase 1